MIIFIFKHPCWKKSRFLFCKLNVSKNELKIAHTRQNYLTLKMTQKLLRKRSVIEETIFFLFISIRPMVEEIHLWFIYVVKKCLFESNCYDCNVPHKRSSLNAVYQDIAIIQDQFMFWSRIKFMWLWKMWLGMSLSF